MILTIQNILQAVTSVGFTIIIMQYLTSLVLNKLSIPTANPIYQIQYKASYQMVWLSFIFSIILRILI